MFENSRKSKNTLLGLGAALLIASCAQNEGWGPSVDANKPNTPITKPATKPKPTQEQQRFLGLFSADIEMSGDAVSSAQIRPLGMALSDIAIQVDNTNNLSGATDGIRHYLTTLKVTNKSGKDIRMPTFVPIVTSRTIGETFFHSAQDKRGAKSDPTGILIGQGHYNSAGKTEIDPRATKFGVVDFKTSDIVPRSGEKIVAISNKAWQSAALAQGKSQKVQFGFEIPEGNKTFRFTMLFAVMDGEVLKKVPTADFVFDSDSPTVEQEITFDAKKSSKSSDNRISKYVFDFGDGSKAVTSNTGVVKHSFTKAGSYKVNVYVIDDNGVKSRSKVKNLEIKEKPKPVLMPANTKRIRLQPNHAALIPMTMASGEVLKTVVATGQELSPLHVSVDSQKRVLIRASSDALPQGLIPVNVKLNNGEERRIAVEIGDFVVRQFNRFNELRKMAGLDAVAFDDEASMNCWLNGRYRVFNDTSGHVENPSLRFATPKGADCAGNSNLSTRYITSDAVSSTTQAVDSLFAAPFHAIGMLKDEQTSVGIGAFMRYEEKYRKYVMKTGITSKGKRTGKLVTFPANNATTDLANYSGSEWPDPLTACTNIGSVDPKTVGLPLIAMTGTWKKTTVTKASLKVDGRDVPICTYGSTQYVNNKDADGAYPEGVKSAQSIGRNILEASGAVLIIPVQGLMPNKTYHVSVDVNGKNVKWQFKTAQKMRYSK